ILFRDEFGQLVVEPMLARVIEERFIANAPLQRRNYEDPEIVPEDKGKIRDEFWDRVLYLVWLAAASSLCSTRRSTPYQIPMSAGSQTL
ncbi:MAG: hypothetical protein Q7U40_07340, partial [Desulfatirhabdiaceae bacterium]|nr:hypothetical protein [Desulfatirhabdiaceae bacterium]